MRQAPEGVKMKKTITLLVFMILLFKLFSLSCYEVQYTTNPSGDSPYANQVVTVEAVVVSERFYTGSSSSNYGFMLGDSNGGPWSGLYVYTTGYSPNRGDLVLVTGTIMEYYGWTEMTSVSSMFVLNQGFPMPPVTTLSTGELESWAEQWESVFVRVNNVEVTSLANNYGEFTVNDGTGFAMINDQCFPRPQIPWPDLEIGQDFYEIRGVVMFSFDQYSINPRDFADLMETELTCDLAISGLGTDYWQDLGEETVLSGYIQNNISTASGDFFLVCYCNDVEVSRNPYLGLGGNGILQFLENFQETEPGYKQVRVAIEMVGDQVPQNNEAETSFIIRPNPTTGVNIGAGDSLLRIPWDTYWRYSLYECLYYPAELVSDGIITGLSFFSDFEMDYTPLPVKLWIGETTLPDLASAWVPATELELVYDDVLVFPGEEAEIYVPFDNAYSYGGGNLVVMAYQEHTWYLLSNDKFQAQIMDGARSRKRYSDAYQPDPNNPPAAIEPTGEVPRVRIYFEPGSAVEDPTLVPALNLSAYPNPIRSTAVFRTDARDAALDIFNLRGQRVRSLSLHQGEANWDARDEAGRSLAAGIYLARLKSGTQSSMSKIILLGE